MGLGDWLMASAEVKEANERTGKKVALGNGNKAFFEPQIFANNPRMALDDKEEIEWVHNYPGKRPYMHGTENGKIIFNDDYKPMPGEIFFSEKELDKINDIDKEYIVVEPNVKTTYIHTVNKSWDKWEELLQHDLPWIQFNTGKQYTKTIQTNTFRDALIVLKKAKLFVGTDGGLHHAAAALGIPSVVIWSGFTSPKHLGYDFHTNIHDGSKPCGKFKEICKHCEEKRKAISVETVYEAIRKELANNTNWSRKT